MGVQVDIAKLDVLFAPFDRGDQPGVAVGVARPLYRRGFGLANVELPIVLSPTIRMRIASTTKHFCCLAVMLLAEDGKLSPDDSPRRFLPELGAWADAITLRQLMSHTSGMRCSLDLLYLTSGISGRRAPGTSFNYCNGGYVLLTEIVARVGGRPFGDVLKERILTPLGMHDSQLRPLDTECLPNSAALHVPNASGGFDRGIFGPPIGGDGGVVSTVDDMLRWLAHMTSPVVGTAATWEAMRTPGRLSNGHSTGYGLGLVVGEYRGSRVVHHAGGVIGGGCQMLKVVDHDLDVIVMTNRAGIDPMALADVVVDACIAGLQPKPEEEPVAPATGTFYAPESGKVIRLIEQDGAQFVDLFVDLYDAKIPARRGRDGALWIRANTTTGATIRSVEDGQAVDYVEFGRTERLERIVPPAEADVTGIVDRYACRVLSVEADVRAPEDGPAILAVTGPFGEVDYRLEPLGSGLWSCATGNFAMPQGGIVEADAEGLRISTMRTRRLRLEKLGKL